MYFLKKRLFKMNLHNFIIIMLYFIKRYKVKYRINKKSLDKLNLLSFIYFYNYFYVQVHLLIQIYTRYFFCTPKFQISRYTDVS